MSAQLNILVVDDETDLIEDLPAVLRTYGISAIATADYAEAVKMAKDTPFDCIVLDLKMPPSADMPHERVDSGRLTGVIVCERLRCVTNAPILVCTSITNRTTHKLACTAGANLILAKPCYPDELVQHIKALARPMSDPT